MSIYNDKMIKLVKNLQVNRVLLKAKIIITLALCCLTYSNFAAAPTVTAQTKVLAHFDDPSTLALDYGANTAITTYGTPEIINNGKHGKCLSLDQGDYISFSGLDNIGSYNEGTIMFWLRPHWDNNQNISHTFCSMRLDNGGYLAMSDGWWETTVGLNKFYFYADRAHLLCSVTTDSALPLHAGQWYHVVMTYRFDGENDSFTKMYINGKLVGADSTVLGTPGTVAPSPASGKFQIGSSAGIEGNSLFGLRYADADFDEFVILNKALSDLEVNSEYQNQNQKAIIAHFDRLPIALDEASTDTTITLIGTPTIINNGIIGQCLSLDNGDYIKIETADNIGEFNEGTVMFWVRPHWNNNLGIAHTFMGMLLNNAGTNGYMAITDGLYSNVNTFYFIPNNQFYLHQTLPDSSVPLVADQWYHIAMTFHFNGDNNSYAKMYINGELVASDNTPLVNTPGMVSPRGMLQLGSSLNIVSGDPRYANADFDELYFSNILLLSDEIKNIYDREKASSIKIKASFNHGIKIDSASNPDNYSIIGTPKLTFSGRAIYDSNRCLSLNNGDYITIEADDNIGEFNEGTVMFWVRPHWNNNQGVAHTFIGMLLNNEGPNGYMAITDGLYSNLNTFYFIPNNQFYLHQTLADSSVPLVADQWYHIAMTFHFNGDNDSDAKMYINGELVASDNTPLVNTPGVVSPRGMLQLGSSLDILSGDPRYADADFSDVTFSTKQLSDTIIKNSYLLGYKYSTFLYRDILKIADEPYKPQVVNSKIKETRFLFDELGSYDSKIAAETLVNKAKAAGFNAIVVCVYHGRGARWNTSTLSAESATYTTLIEGKEPLQYLIDYAHSQGIDIHAWFTVNACYGDLLVDGSTMIDLFRNNGWIDDSFRVNDHNYNVIVHYVGFRTWISRLVLEVLQKYNIDGVTLDYIRAKGFCTTQYCQDDYSEKYGRDLLNDIAAEDYEHLKNWNYNAVTKILIQVNTKVKTENPNIPISICGNLWDDDHTTAAFAEQGRDGLSWIELGYIDFTLFMDYSIRPDYEYFRASVANLTDGAYGKAGFIISNYVTIPELGSRDAEYTANLLSMAQQMNTGIVACYWYGRLTDAMISAFKAGPFKDEAVPHYK